MIVCCYTQIKKQWTGQELTDKLLLLPEDQRQSAQQKRRWIDKQLTIAGKLLLLKALKALRVESKFKLSDLLYNSHKRPYFDGNIDFNISHSADVVICCATDKGMIGADIEEVKEIDLSYYPNYFTSKEWQYINGHNSKFDGFYNFWTRKEAVLKAIGTGFHTPLDEVDVSEDMITYDDIDYYIRSINISHNYKCHIATTIKQDDIRLLPVELS
jgi:4'-phosphopantetheinyl transferase